MHCDHCGSENRVGSNFCRSCGKSLSESVSAAVAKRIRVPNGFSWKNPAVLGVAALIVLGSFAYGSTKAYAFLKVESKIGSAKKLQAKGDYAGSIAALTALESAKLTAGEKTKIQTIRDNDEKYIAFKSSFDAAVAVENSQSARSSSSANLQKALRDLQAIDSDYPEYKSVQAEITKVQGVLVDRLEGESDTNKKAAADASASAAKNKAAAQAAQAAKEQAEANAEEAKSAADAAAANAAAQAAARGAEVAKAFRNELAAGYISYTQGANYYSSAISYSNNSQSILALSQANSARAVLNSASSTVSDLSTRYSGLPASYYRAASDMMSAISNLNHALDLLVSSEGTSLDYSSQINAYKNTAVAYQASVKAFLDSTSQ